jgi:hypothetical protein
MNTITKTLGAFAVAGIVAAGGSAFTAGGITNPVNAASGFIGGTVTQTSTGATLSNVVYDVDATAGAGQDSVTKITLTFTSTMQNRVVKVAANSNLADADFTCAVGDGTVIPFTVATCDPVGGVPFPALSAIKVSVAGH